MRLLRRIAGIFGLIKDETHDDNNIYDADDHRRHHNHGGTVENRRPTRGFSLQVPVVIERAPIIPVITPSNLGRGGVQGLKWYEERLRIDEDGDVADEFIDEFLPETSATDNQRPLSKFEVKYSTDPVKVRNQVIAVDGKIHQNVEYQGRMRLV